MTQAATVQGLVQYRIGEGPVCKIPRGPIEVEVTGQDVTLSWETEETRQVAALPRQDFARYLAEKAIVYLNH